MTLAVTGRLGQLSVGEWHNQSCTLERSLRSKVEMDYSKTPRGKENRWDEAGRREALATDRQQACLETAAAVGERERKTHSRDLKG